MRQNPSESEKLESFERFREEMSKDVDEGVDDHESKMTKMGFMFLGIFVGVIALAAFLPRKCRTFVRHCLFLID